MPKFTLLLMLGISSYFSTYSQTCCSGGIPLSNSIGLPSSSKGTFLLGISYDYNNLNTLNNGNSELDDNARLRTTQSLLFNIGYSITTNFSVEALFTYVNQKRTITQFGNVNTDEIYGVGDGVLLFKYNFNRIFEQNNTLRIGLGAKVPIGATDKKSENGILLNADMQPGSGAWDFIFWSFYSHSFSFRPSGEFIASATYRLTGTNNNYLNLTTYRFGPEFQSFIGYVDQFMINKTLINPGVRIKYRHAGRDEIGGFALDNTGGEWVSIIPSVDVEISTKLNLLTKFEIPMYSYVEGTQLTPTYRITIGLFYNIDRRKKDLYKLK